MDLPITETDIRNWHDSDELIQNYFPQLSNEQREFLLSGVTPEEWAKEFPPEDEEQEIEEEAIQEVDREIDSQILKHLP